MVVTYRQSCGSGAPGFLGAYADDLLLGHADPVFLLRLHHQLEIFYRIIGGEINYDKSEWMVVHGHKSGRDRPVETGGLKLVPSGGHIVYLGFRVYGDGRFEPRSSIQSVFRHASLLLPGGVVTARWATQFVCGVLGGWILYYGGVAAPSNVR